MASFIEALVNCIVGTEPDSPSYTQYPPEKVGLLSPQPIRTTEETADLVVKTLKTTKKSGQDLRATLDEIVGTNGWTERLVEWALHKLEQALREAHELSPVLREAYEKSYKAAEAMVKSMKDFAEEHPVFFGTLVAIGVLAVLAPWMVGVLGFAEEGIVEGSFAAAWQSRYAGLVPKGSLFSFLQSLGMKLKWTL